MKNRIDSSFFAAVVRLALGYALGRTLYDLGRFLIRWLGILFFMGLLGVLTAIALWMRLLGPN